MNTDIIDVVAVPNTNTELLAAVDFPRRVSLVNEGNVAESVYCGFESGVDPKFEIVAGVNVVLYLPARKPLYAVSTPAGGNNVSGTATDMQVGMTP